MEEKKYLKIAYAIITLSFFIRIIIAFYFSDNWLTPDSKNYILQANELLNGGFGLYFPNGYPALIALITLISGNESREIILIILNIILSTCSVWIFWLICKQYFGINLYSLAAVIIFAFYPNQLNYVKFVLTEVPSLFFLLLSFFFISKNNFSFAGLTIGIAATIKPVLLPLLVFFTLFLFYKKDLGNGTRFISLAAIPVAMMMFLGFLITGTITIGYSSVHSFYLSVNQPELLSNSIWDAISYYLNYAINHPLRFLFERIQSLWEFWGFWPAANEGLRENLIFKIMIGIRFPLLLLAIYGFFKAEKNDLVIFSSLTIITLTVMHFIFYSTARYNFAAEPYLIFLAVQGFKNSTLNFTQSNSLRR